MPTELSWTPQLVDSSAKLKEGDIVRVKILRYAPNRGAYVGSVRQISPAENNPYVAYAKNGVNAVYTAKLTSLDSTEAPGIGRVELPDGVRGSCWLGPLRNSLQVGDSIRVYAVEVDHERGFAAFHPCDQSRE